MIVGLDIPDDHCERHFPDRSYLGMQVRVNEIQNILPIRAEDTTSASAVAVEAEGCYPGYQVAITKEVCTPRVAEAGATTTRVVGQQHGVVAHEASIKLD